MRDNSMNKQQQAQAITNYLIGDSVYPRILWGSEQQFTDFASSSPRCPGCGVGLGLYHVPGCAAEECPKCGGQAVRCACDNAMLAEE